MYYFILLGAIAIFLGGAFLVHRLFKDKEKLIVERIFVFILIAVFIVRFMSYNDVQFQTINYSAFSNLGGPNNNKFLNLVGNLCLWLEATAALMVFLRPWSHFKTAKFYVKFIALQILFVSSIAI